MAFSFSQQLNPIQFEERELIALYLRNFNSIGFINFEIIINAWKK